MNAHAKYICIADGTLMSRQSAYNQLFTQEKHVQKQSRRSLWQNLYARRICTHRFMVRSQSVQGVALKKRLQSRNESGTFVNSSNGTHFSPKSLSDRLSRRNDGLIPAWANQVMVYVNPSHIPRAGFVRIRSGGWGYWHTHGVSCGAHRTLSNYLLPSCNPRYNRANDFSPINRSYP